MVSPVILTAHNDVLDETLDEDWDLSTPSSAYSDQVPFWDDGREDEATEEDETPGATASYSKGPASVIARADKFFTSIFTDYCSQAALCIDMDQSPTETSDEEAVDTASRFTCKGSECTGTVHFAGAPNLAKERASKVLNSLRRGDGSWDRFLVKDPTDQLVQVFLGAASPPRKSATSSLSLSPWTRKES